MDSVEKLWLKIKSRKGHWHAAGFHPIAQMLGGIYSPEECDHFFVDSQFANLLLRLCNARFDRTPGPDLFSFGLQDRDVEHGLIGGSMVELNTLKSKFKNVHVFETVIGDVQTLSASDIIEKINDSNIDILWVGFGCPKQDLWMIRNKLLLNVNVVVGVGAAFKFEASEVRRAPQVAREWGLEWLWRLMSEPRLILSRLLSSGIEIAIHIRNLPALVQVMISKIESQ